MGLSKNTYVNLGNDAGRLPPANGALSYTQLENTNLNSRD